MARTPSKTFRALAEPNARWYFAGLLVSNVGTWLQATAQVLLVRRLGGSGLELGIATALQFLPLLLLGLWAGAVSDRRNRYTTTLITQTAMGAQALALGVLDLTGHVSIGTVYVLSLVLGLLNAIDNPARRGLATELVDPADLSNVLALNTAVMTGSRVFGPALAALLVAGVGTGWCFVVNGISFLAMLGGLFALDQHRLRRVAPAPPSATPVRDGLRAVWTEPVARRTLIVFTIVATFAFNYAIALPLLVTHRLRVDDDTFGWLLSVISIGSVTGSLLTARREQVGERWFYGALGMLVVGNVGLAAAADLWVAYLACLPLGIGSAAFVSTSNVILQTRTDPALRGRVLALVAVAFLGSTPIGGPITGFIGDEVGASWAMLYGACIAAGCGVWGAAQLRSAGHDGAEYVAAKGTPPA